MKKLLCLVITLGSFFLCSAMKGPENTRILQSSSSFEMGSRLPVKKRLTLSNPNAPLDSTGKTSLHYAAAQGRFHTTRRLLRAGANPNCEITSMSYKGYTPLHYAAENGAPVRVIQALLQAGANPNKKTPIPHCETPLSCALEQDHAALGRLLIEAGAEISGDAWIDHVYIDEPLIYHMLAEQQWEYTQELSKLNEYIPSLRQKTLLIRKAILVAFAQNKTYEARQLYDFARTNNHKHLEQTLRKALIYAVTRGDVHAGTNLLKNFNVTVSPKTLDRIINIAIINDHEDVFFILLENFASTPAIDLSALFVKAITHHATRVITILLSRDFKPTAALFEYIKAIKTIESSADASEREAYLIGLESLLNNRTFDHVIHDEQISNATRNDQLYNSLSSYVAASTVHR